MPITSHEHSFSLKGDIMSERKSDVSAKNCAVRYEDDVPVFSGTVVTMKGTISRKLGDKMEYQKNVTWTCDLDGVPVCDCLEPFGASIRIKMAVVRDRDDYREVIERLDGSTVHFNDISDWTDKGTEGRKMTPEKKLKNAATVFETLSDEEQEAYIAELLAKKKAQKQS